MGGIEDKLILLLSTNQWQYLIYFEFFFFAKLSVWDRLYVVSNEANCFFS